MVCRVSKCNLDYLAYIQSQVELNMSAILKEDIPKKQKDYINDYLSKQTPISVVAYDVVNGNVIKTEKTTDDFMKLALSNTKTIYKKNYFTMIGDKKKDLSPSQVREVQRKGSVAIWLGESKQIITKEQVSMIYLEKDGKKMKEPPALGTEFVQSYDKTYSIWLQTLNEGMRELIQEEVSKIEDEVFDKVIMNNLYARTGKNGNNGLVKVKSQYLTVNHDDARPVEVDGVIVIQPQRHKHRIVNQNGIDDNGTVRTVYAKDSYDKQVQLDKLTQAAVATYLKSIGVNIKQHYKKDGDSSPDRFIIDLGPELNKMVNEDKVFSSMAKAIEDETNKRKTYIETWFKSTIDTIKQNTTTNKAQKDSLMLEAEEKYRADIQNLYSPAIQKVIKKNIKLDKLGISQQDLESHFSKRFGELRDKNIGFDHNSLVTERNLSDQELLELMTKHRAKFSKDDLTTFIACHQIGIGNLETIQTQTERLLAQCLKAKVGNEYVYTTQNALDTEHSIITLAKDLKQASYSFSEGFDIQPRLTHTTLTDEQKDYLADVFSSSRLSLVQGKSGVGKSFAMKEVQEITQEQGKTILFITNKTGNVANLKKDGLDNVSTTARLLVDPNIQSKLTKDTILTVDEAGEISAEQLKQVMDLVATKGAKLVLVGDVNQNSAIERGRPMAQLIEQYDTVTLKGIKRQVEGDERKLSELVAGVKDINDLIASGMEQKMAEREVSKLMAEGKVAHVYMDEIEKQGKVNMCLSNNDAINSIVHGYMKDKADYQDKNVLCMENKTVFTINSLIQQKRIEAGELSESKTTSITNANHEKIKCLLGEEILFNSVHREYTYTNGKKSLSVEIPNKATATIVDIRQQGQVTYLDLKMGNKRVTVKAPANELDIKLAYTRTNHSSQGMSKGSTHVFLENSMVANCESIYVLTTRHKESMKIYSNRDDWEDVKELYTRASKDDVVLNMDWQDSKGERVQPKLSLSNELQSAFDHAEKVYDFSQLIMNSDKIKFPEILKETLVDKLITLSKDEMAKTQSLFDSFEAGDVTKSQEAFKFLQSVYGENPHIDKPILIAMRNAKMIDQKSTPDLWKAYTHHVPVLTR